MSSNYALKASKRDRAGKGVARTLRRENKVPGVIYGDAKEPVKISLSDKDINLEYRKGHMYTSLCDLDIDGTHHLALARDVQLHPVSDRVEHIDFMRVTPKTTIVVHVPVHFINHNDSPGLKEKAVLNVVLHELELVCLATDIPEQVDVDLAGKKLGEAVRLSDAKIPNGAKAVTVNKSKDYVIATLQAPRAYVEMEITAPTPDAAAGAAAAPGAAPAAGAAAPAAGAAPAKGAAPAPAGAKAPAAPAKK